MLTWVLVANASEACLYKSDNLRTDDLELIQRFEHSESRQKGTELLADRPGHYATDNAARSAYEKTDPKIVEMERFSKALAKFLKKDKPICDNKQMVFIAPPHFYGLLKKDLGCKNCPVAHIAKDYTKLSTQDLLKRIREQLFPI